MQLQESQNTVPPPKEYTKEHNETQQTTVDRYRERYEKMQSKLAYIQQQEYEAEPWKRPGGPPLEPFDKEIIWDVYQKYGESRARLPDIGYYRNAQGILCEYRVENS